ncbi:MAG: hypothetical protein ACREBU_20650 [Nitrososphaera sp.]
MNILKRILLAPFIGYRWVRVLDLASKGDFCTAAQVLDQLAPFFENKDAEYHLLKGFLSFSTTLDKSVIKNMRIAISLIEESLRYSEEEKKYLKCYASIWANKAQAYIDEQSQKKFETIDYNDVNLSKIRPALKSNFPLRSHPEWDK